MRRAGRVAGDGWSPQAGTRLRLRCPTALILGRHDRRERVSFVDRTLPLRNRAAIRELFWVQCQAVVRLFQFNTADHSHPH